jgi:hypothetical protein
MRNTIVTVNVPCVPIAHKYKHRRHGRSFVFERNALSIYASFTMLVLPSAVVEAFWNRKDLLPQLAA